VCPSINMGLGGYSCDFKQMVQFQNEDPYKRRIVQRKFNLVRSKRDCRHTKPVHFKIEDGSQSSSSAQSSQSSLEDGPSTLYPIKEAAKVWRKSKVCEFRKERQEMRRGSTQLLFEPSKNIDSDGFDERDVDMSTTFQGIL